MSLLISSQLVCSKPFFDDLVADLFMSLLGAGELFCNRAFLDANLKRDSLSKS